MLHCSNTLSFIINNTTERNCVNHELFVILRFLTINMVFNQYIDSEINKATIIGGCE